MQQGPEKVHWGPDRIVFGQLGIAFGQSLELSVVNVGLQGPPEPDAPAMELQIIEVVDNFTGRTSFAFQAPPDPDSQLRAP